VKGDEAVQAAWRVEAAERQAARLVEAARLRAAAGLGRGRRPLGVGGAASDPPEELLTELLTGSAFFVASASSAWLRRLRRSPSPSLRLSRPRWDSQLDAWRMPRAALPDSMGSARGT